MELPWELWLGIGMATYVGMSSTLQNKVSKEPAKQWNPVGKEKDNARLLKRARSALRPGNWWQVTSLFTFGFMGMVLVSILRLVDIRNDPMPFLTGELWVMVLGHLAALVVSLPLGMFRRMRLLRLARMQGAARALGNRCSPGDAMPVLKAAASSNDRLLRAASTAGLAEIGLPEAGELLEQMAKDNDPEVASAATTALEAWRRIGTSTRPLPVRSVKELVRQHRQLHRASLSGSDALISEVGKDVDRIALAIETLVLPQAPLRAQFPAVYCVSCRAWAERHTYLEWSWVTCRLCEDSVSLMGGVRKVVGVIGEEVQRVLEGEVLHLTLWKVAGREALAADIDLLEVRGGKEVDYDWALNAVLERMDNERSGRWFPIELVGEVALSGNTEEVLAAWQRRAGA